MEISKDEALNEIEWIVRKIYKKFYISREGNFIQYDIDDNDKDKNAPSYSDQWGILDKMEKRGAIKIYEKEFKKHLSNIIDESKENFIKIEILQPQFDKFYGWIKNKYSSPISSSENMNSEGANIEIPAGRLSLWRDGTIRYRNKIIPLRKQLKSLCMLFIKNPNMLITYDKIKDEIIKADRRSAIHFKTIAKYVSELRRSLKVHFGKNVIICNSGEGWHFKD
jgi:hypothetical protein